MKIDIKRKLENKVFTTTFKRIVEHDDPEKDREKELENDFGPVKLFTGGVVSGKVSLVDGKVSIAEENDQTALDIKFNAKGITLSLTDGAEFSYSCDAKNETAKSNETHSLTELQVAEAKCKIYEAFIRANVKKVVSEWRKQVTAFEVEEVLSIEEDLTPSI